MSEQDLSNQIDDLDSGKGENVSDELKQDYKVIVEAANFIGEEKFRSNLQDIHSNMNSGTFFGKHVYWMSGVAATMIGAFFWWQSLDTRMTTPELQMNETPIYGDSAIYDSTKNIQPTVDKPKE
ncbi:MAG: hypothetical protein JXR03_07135 [Cyclobacteriaceae bacterium]